VIKKPLTIPTSNLFVEDLFSYKRSKLSIFALVFILVLATLNLGTNKSYAAIDVAARLIGAGTGSYVTFTADSNCSGGMRGVTSDGTYVYFRTNASTGGYICKVPLAGGTASSNPVTNLSGIAYEQMALTYSNGCIFIRQNTSAASGVYCIDPSNWNMSPLITPSGKEIPLGGGWLLGNLMNFPDGRVGAVSVPNSGAPSGGVACPSSRYCKYLRLYTVARTGTWPTLTWDQDITLADAVDSGWPSDDHGMATDGTYLYQIMHENGYKVWQLASGSASEVVFNGAGSGTCGASAGTSGTMCYIYYPVSTSLARFTNATFIGRSHATNQYIIGDYSAGGKFFLSASAAPPAGIGTSISITTITNKLSSRGSTTATATASSGTPTYSASGACSVNSSTGVVTFTSTGNCTLTASVGSSPNTKTASTTFEIVQNLTQRIISRAGVQPNSLSTFIPPPYLSTARSENAYACLDIVDLAGATVLTSTNLNISLNSISGAAMTSLNSGKSYTINGTLTQVQTALSTLKINSTSGRIMAANSGSIYLRVRANLIADATTDAQCLDIGNDGRITLYQYTSDQVRRKNVPQKSGSTP